MEKMDGRMGEVFVAMLVALCGSWWLVVVSRGEEKKWPRASGIFLWESPPSRVRKREFFVMGGEVLKVVMGGMGGWLV